MDTLIEDFTLIPVRMEIEETPVKWTQPDDEEEDPESDIGDDDPLDATPDDRPHVGPYEFPQENPDAE